MRRLIAIGVCLVCATTSARALNLPEAYALALAHDAEFASETSAAVAGAEAQVQGRAMLRPKISVSGQFERKQLETELDPSVPVGNLLSPSASGNVYGYSISLRQPLYRQDAFGGSSQLLRRAEIAELTYGNARQDLILRVANGYFRVLLSQESLAFAVAQKAATAEQLAAAKERFDTGRATITDVTEAQARYDALVAQEIAAESELAVNRARFASLTGDDGTDLAAIGLSPKPQPPMPNAVETWIERARQGNFSIQVREREVAIAEADVDKARLKGRPTVDLVASYGNTRQSGELSPLLYPEDSKTKSVGVQFSMPLFEGGALQSKLRETLANRARARQLLEATRREADVSVRQTFLDVQSGALRVAALEQALVSAQTSLEAATLGREVGVRTNLDVLTLQQQLYSSKRDLAQARYEYLMSRLQLNATVGELNENALNARWEDRGT